MAYQRSERVQELMKEEISDIIRTELKDPRIGFVTVTNVQLSSDLRNAKVFVSVYGDEKAKEQTLKGLESGTGFIRSEIGKRIRLRFVPEITFRLDESIEQGARVFELLNKVKKDERNEGKA